MLFLPLATSLFCFAVSALADNSTILSSEIDVFVNDLLAEWNSPGGVAVAVVRMDGQGSWLVETKGYGTATTNGSKVTPDTIFSVGSNSKLFDVLATGLLISNESLSPQISWNTKLASLIPSWKLVDPVATSESTITDLMSHRIGLPSHDFGYFRYNDSVPALVERMQYLKPSAPFRWAFQYTNMMYAILSYLPTVLLPDKPSFVRYITDNIISPLGLNSTTYSYAVANATGRMANGFAREATTANPLDAGIPHALPWFFGNTGEPEVGDTFSGPGGVLTTAVDAARWLQMLLSNGLHPDTNATVVPASVIETVGTGVSVTLGNPQWPELSPAVYGGGLIQWSYRGYDMVEHNGAVPGFFAQITRLPEDGAGVAVFTNEDLGEFTSYIIKYRIIDAILGMDPVDWDSRYKAEVQQAASAVAGLVPGPPNASLPFELAAAQGNYRNLGYGPDITLCAPSAGSSNCTALLATLNNTFPEELAQADLIWAWDTIIATYVLLKHFDGALFNVTAFVPEPTANASSPFWAYSSGLEGNVAEFELTNDTISGFGIRGRNMGRWGYDRRATRPYCRG
ncbi:Beta-lactamase class penicillin binding protein [Mycena sanguinolenta]|uniref:Beta-lactamase class penicillin binding protein n=1 Tax=Mycena sanguinolenta TaxID=230812 RepID=A0A8H7CFB1_9AGAR|nr:Beta-lactamase class penicillin binding protein [Mycena sanguinolenta]